MAKPLFNHMSWSEDDEKQLIQMRNVGMSYKGIGRKLGRSEKACQIRFSRIKSGEARRVMPPRPVQPQLPVVSQESIDKSPPQSSNALRLPPSLRHKLVKSAAAHGYTMQEEMIERLDRSYMKSEPKQPKPKSRGWVLKWLFGGPARLPARFRARG